MKRNLRAPVALLLAGGLAASLHASSFSVFVPGDQIVNSPGPVGLVAPGGTAFAGNGHVGISGIEAASGNTSSTFARANSVVDDLVFSGPGATVQTRFIIPFSGIFGSEVQNLFDLNGVLAASSFGGPQIFLNAQMVCQTCFNGLFLDGALEVDFDSREGPPKVRGNRQDSENITLAFLLSLPISGNINGTAVGGFDDNYIYGITGFFDSGLVTIPTGVPFELTLDLQASAQTLAGSITSGSGFFDLSHTFGLPQGVPIFDLPPGFTANAPSIGLIGNQIAPSEVPEPASLAMAALGFAVLLGIRRARV
jgi:PEP-CTERM motif